MKSEFGIVQQHLSLNRDLTIAENLELHARLHHLSRADRKKRIAELLEYVELSDHADYLVDDVSGSMKMGKALIGVVRGLISSVAFLVVALLIAPNMHVGPLFLAGLVLTCLTFSFLRLLARSHEDMATFGSLILIPMTFLGGTFFSLSQVPEGLKYALYILPLTHASLFLRAAALDQPLPWASFLALLVYFVAFLWGGMIALKRASV